MPELTSKRASDQTASSSVDIERLARMPRSVGSWRAVPPPVSDNGNPWRVVDQFNHGVAIVVAPPREGNAKVLASAPDLLAALKRARREIAELREVIRDEYAGHEAYVDNTPCDAGNFDGGSVGTCEHCGHQRRLKVLDSVLEQGADDRA